LVSPRHFDGSATLCGRGRWEFDEEGVSRFELGSLEIFLARTGL
jgi:hypothetical protein